MKKLIISLTLIFWLQSCEDTPIDQSYIWNCHHEISWDLITTSNNLIGDWEWEYIECYSNIEDANKFVYKGLLIEFKSDNTLDVKVSGQIIQTSNWKLVHGDADLFAIDVDPRVPQLYGRILFCNDRVEFNDSYIDGCDNYFTRK